jgi:mannose-6-phosphate isomerase-like protein (cupin superfamily)
MNIVKADRPAALHQLAPSAQNKRAIARAQNFIVEQVFGRDGEETTFASSDEVMLLLPDSGGRLTGSPQEGNDTTAEIREPGIVIVPPGTHGFRFAGGGRLFILATNRTDLDDEGIANAAAYAEPDPCVAPVGTPFRRVSGVGEVQVLPIATVPYPATNPRLKFVQSSTMSINWVEYAEPRDRTALSPHAHDDLEQGSLAIEGQFLHHLRTPWGKNADLWRDDVHLNAGPSSLLIIPPEIIHTTEGVGSGRHLLIDIFAPPRRDFIAKEWVFNAGDYEDPQGV